MFIEDLIAGNASSLIVKDKTFEDALSSSDSWIIDLEVEFYRCYFREGLLLYGNVFQKSILFKNCKFNDFNLSSCSFNSKFSIVMCEFDEEFTVNSCNFEKQAYLLKNKFHKGVNFFKPGYENGSIEFNGGLVIE